MEAENKFVRTETQPSNSSPKSVTNWPLIFCLLLLGVIFIAGSLYVGIQIGKSNSQITVSTDDLISPTPSQMEISPSQSPALVSPTAKPKIEFKTYQTTKLPDLSFPAITIKYPADWGIETKTDTEGVGMMELKLAKNGYVVTLYQAAMGGGVCLFDDSPSFEGPSSDYRTVKYTQLQAGFGTLRYFVNPSNSQKIVFCQKSDELYSSLGIGVLSIDLPSDANTETFQEAIEIVKSITINK